MALKPIRDKIVVKLVEESEQTTGGIFIPDSAKEKPQKGEVIAIGEGKYNESGIIEKIPVSVGQVVLFAKYTGTDVKVDGVEYKIISVKDVLAIYE